MFRTYQGASSPCAIRAQMAHASRSRSRCSSPRSWRCRSIPRQFFPSSDRPELLVDLSLPQNASIYASETAGPALRCRSQGRSRRRALEHLCRPRRDPLLPAARCPAAEQFLRAGGDRRQGCRRARSPASQSSSKLLAERFPQCRRSRLSAWSSVRRSVGRCSTASAARTSRQVRDIALKLGQRRCRQSASDRRQLRLDRAGAAGRASGSIRTKRGCWA